LVVVAAMASAVQTATSAAPPQNPNGETIFASKCLLCHGAGLRAPSLEQLRKLSPQHVYEVLTTGAMQQQAASLSDADKRAVAAYLGEAEKVQPRADLNPCKTASPSASASGTWIGWSTDEQNARYQASPAAGLSVKDVPSLKLKWAFVFPGANTAGNQPTIQGDELYTGSWDGTIYALDAQSGCSYWTFKADAGVRTAIVLAGNVGIFGDFKANVYAVDLTTGKQLWKTRIDQHPEARITASPVVWQDRVYVSVSSLEEGLAEDPKYECCTFRGSVVALKIADGSQVWKSYTIDEAARSTGKSKAGTQQFGPAGGAVWSSPTIDAKRKLVYVTDGNAYTSPEPPTTEAVAALDMDTGKRRWVKQLNNNDTWNGACMQGQDTSNCPEKEGPDFDFGAAPALVTRVDGRDLVLAGQKSGFFYGLNPDTGDLVWKVQVGHGGVYGGIEWGFAADSRFAYVPISDRDINNLQADGALNAVDLSSGQRTWRTPNPSGACAPHPDLCSLAQPAAATLIPGVVFSGSLDGHLRGYDAATGKIIWDFDTDQAYDGVNHVKGHGGSLGAAGPTVANGMVYQTSGYASYGLGMPGNVLLALAPQK
jgi:polyvinyl alcohol dehydrogenase (cytochrome)